MSTISKNLRIKLGKEAVIPSIKTAAEKSSVDGTTKFLFELSDGYRIESVLIPPKTAFRDARAAAEEEQKRLTLCVSTQVGCPLKCRFCATGTMGLIRDLTTGEIVDQVIQTEKRTGKRITNLVFMGMGEPLLNYESVVKSIDIFTAGMAIAARHITVSTVGLVPEIRRIAAERRKFKLAVSIHSLDDDVRSSVIPIARKYPLGELLDAVEYYYKSVKRRPTFEYILFDGINDRESDIRKLVKLSKRVPCKVNVIPFHSVDFAYPTGIAPSLRPTPPPRLDEFVEKLRESHVTVFVRSSAGESIEAACGQLAVALETGKHPHHARK